MCKKCLFNSHPAHNPLTRCALNRATAVVSLAALAAGLTVVSATSGSVPQAAAAEATASALGRFTGSLDSPETMEFSTAPTEIGAVDDLTWDSK